MAKVTIERKRSIVLSFSHRFCRYSFCWQFCLQLQVSAMQKYGKCASWLEYSTLGTVLIVQPWLIGCAWSARRVLTTSKQYREWIQTAREIGDFGKSTISFGAATVRRLCCGLYGRLIVWHSIGYRGGDCNMNCQREWLRNNSLRICLTEFSINRTSRWQSRWWRCMREKNLRPSRL